LYILPANIFADTDIFALKYRQPIFSFLVDNWYFGQFMPLSGQYPDLTKLVFTYHTHVSAQSHRPSSLRLPLLLYIAQPSLTKPKLSSAAQNFIIIFVPVLNISVLFINRNY
jgi:hypothetical protein